MNVIRKTVSAFGGIVLAALLITVFTPKAARAIAAALVQIVPGTTTHVGQHESQLISLRCFEGKAYCSEVEADGTADESTTYVVPKGYTLVVTDYEWQVNSPSGGLLGDYLYNFEVGTFNASVAVAVQTGVDYNAYGHEHYATGFRVGSGVKLADSQAFNSTGGGYVQGYLVPND